MKKLRQQADLARLYGIAADIQRLPFNRDNMTQGSADQALKKLYVHKTTVSRLRSIPQIKLVSEAIDGYIEGIKAFKDGDYEMAENLIYYAVKKVNAFNGRWET
ncbi:hypothetical protein NST54_01105 [Caldifermentibacillus hisashii]|jgi:hypothetical protein|uniref:hypothetical protein n=1 Tax=Caldifermentibacillus hisashii TaxID=996558 RepID=UPI0034D56782